MPQKARAWWQLGKQRPAKSGVPPVLEWTQGFSLPDDLLYVRHHSSGGDDLIFLASLDADGGVAAIRPISGYSIYMSAAGEQIKQAARVPALGGRTVIFQAPDPLNKYTSDVKSFGGGSCTPATDLRRLYQLGAYLRNQEQDSGAARCYRLILELNPDSLAGRWGAAQLCWSAKDSECGEEYTKSVIASNPEFIEARADLARHRLEQQGYEGYIGEVDDILKLDMPLAERAALLDLQIFRLRENDRIDDVIPVIKRWMSVITELLQVYRPAFRYYVQAFDAAMLEESKGLTADALVSYRLAATAADFDRSIPESRRYDVDLGLARTLRRAGNAADAKALCDRWVRRRNHLINRPPRAPWEAWQDGSGEVEGRWEFSCGSPEKGLQLIQASSRKYPDSNAAYTALSEYYYTVGDVEKAREAAATASRLMRVWAHRLGQFEGNSSNR